MLNIETIATVMVKVWTAAKARQRAISQGLTVDDPTLLRKLNAKVDAACDRLKAVIHG